MAEHWYNAFNVAPQEPKRATQARPAGADRDVAPADLQAAEIDRLSRLNERLMDRVATLLELQEREQILRQQMQNQIDRLSERLALPAPAEQPAQAGTAEELKPLLMMIVSLLERTLPRTRPEEHPVATPPAPARPERAELPELPAFLRQPPEGTGPAHAGRDTGHRGQEAAAPDLPRGAPPRGTQGSGRRRDTRSPLPEAFAWTSLFS